MNAKGIKTELLQCPYDKTHMIMRFRFQNHLIKCRRNHTHVEKKTCPFNVSHILDPEDLDHHVKTCPDRASFERFKMQEQHTLPAAEMPKMPKAGPDGEDWDSSDVPAYNPSVYAASAPVMREIQGAQPAERRQFRQAESARLRGEDKGKQL